VIEVPEDQPRAVERGCRISLELRVQVPFSVFDEDRAHMEPGLGRQTPDDRFVADPFDDRP
jgi:hypothetical protein